MTGQVRCFLPASRRGILRTETGEELIFTMPQGLADLAGGDSVEFQLGNDGGASASNVILRRRWVETLNRDHRSLVNEFHDTIEILA